MRALLNVLGIVVAASSFAQLDPDPNMTDFECRNALNEALPSFRHAGTTRLDEYSMVFKMDTTETIGTQNSVFTSYLSYYDDLAPRSEMVQAEMLNFRKNLSTGEDLLVQRIAADGKRVWSYDAVRNEYAVQYYNGEGEDRSRNYRSDFFNLFRTPVEGQPLDLVTLLNQLTGTAPRIRDWVGVTQYEGFDNHDPLAGARQIWQKTPDGSRYVRFYLVKTDGTWKIDNIIVRRLTNIGSQVRRVESIIRSMIGVGGTPLLMNRNESRFFFTPPTRSKFIASPRTIKF
jgi:hypothetical protein